MWFRANQHLDTLPFDEHRNSLIRCALTLLFMLAFSVQVALANEHVPGTAVDGEGEAQSLRTLIRSGVRAYEKGDLAGADAEWARVRDRYPEHPAAATFELITLQARRSLDYWGGQYDDAIEERAEEAVVLSRAWLERAPDSPQAHFYLGRALAEMMVIDGIASRYYKAGTEGEEARGYLETALELDPGFVDAKLPLGLYYYYGSIATRYIPFLRWLWFVPKGDRDLGLAYVEEVSRGGDLLGFAATDQLASLYIYVEERPDLAEPLLLELGRRHPQNSSVHFELIELRFRQQDYPGTVAAALALEQKQGDQFGDETRRHRARIWRARAELHRGHVAEADALVRSLEIQSNEFDSWSQSWLLVVRGQLHDLAGEREQAIASYSHISQKKSQFGFRRTAELARKGLEAPFALEIPSVAAAP